MNDRLVVMGFLLFFILIGMNGFILVTGQLKTQDGTLLMNAIGPGIIVNEKPLYDYVADKNVDVNGSVYDSDALNTATGFAPVQIDDAPAGLDFLNYPIVMAIGAELFMGKLAELVPFLAPIFYAVITLFIVFKLLMMAFIGSLLIRAIFGRQV